jgi:hypothetical protein
MELQMPEGEGTRGAAVVYDSTQKKYIAAFAGNAVYPLAVFDKAGKMISDPGLQTGADVRSLWVDKKGGIYCSNFGGMEVYMLSEKKDGQPALVGDEFEFPDQAVGVFHPGVDMLFFFDGKNVMGYSYPDGKLVLQVMLEINEDDNPYNSTSLVLMPNKDQSAQFGLLNLNDASIDFFDAFTGKKQRKIALPDDAPLNESFNFSYANGIFWLFNIELRKWIGYK